MSDINPTIGPFEAAINNLYNSDKASTALAESGLLQGSGSPRLNGSPEALTNTPPVVEREITTLDIGEIKNVPMDLMRTIFSYLRGSNNNFLSLCRTLRSYLLKYGNWQVAFDYAKFLKLEQEKQIEIMDLIQKIGVNFIVNGSGLNGESTVMQLEDVYAAICRAPQVFKQATLAITVGFAGLRWLRKKGDDPNFVQRIVGLHLDDVTLTESSGKLTLDFISKCTFLTTLRIWRICANDCVETPRSLTALTTLTFDEICEGTTVKISENLTALTSLSAYPKGANISVDVPASLKGNLKNLFLHPSTGILQWI